VGIEENPKSRKREKETMRDRGRTKRIMVSVGGISSTNLERDDRRRVAKWEVECPVKNPTAYSAREKGTRTGRPSQLQEETGKKVHKINSEVRREELGGSAETLAKKEIRVRAPFPLGG